MPTIVQTPTFRVPHMPLATAITAPQATPAAPPAIVTDPDTLLSILELTCQQWLALSDDQKRAVFWSRPHRPDQTETDVALAIARLNRRCWFGAAAPAQPPAIATDPDTLLSILRLDCRSWLALSDAQKRAAFWNTPHRPDMTETDVSLAIARLNRHCWVSAAPAGSAYTTASSYTNGPTLLAAVVAFAAGYAVAHYTR